jgi:ABC-type uncharacterized transport system substrate-binding protein
MTFFMRRWVLATLMLLTGAGAANAHPHVFVVVKSQLVYGPDGSLKAIRHAWTFDEMFSSFAIQGLDKNGDGKFSREELAELAKENVQSLKEFAYFTMSKTEAKKIEFGEPADYWLEADDKNVLTLNFTLPVTSAGFKGNFELDVYDPTYFIAFSLAEGNPVSLSGAPPGCAINAKGPGSEPATPGDALYKQLQAGADWGAQFANKITVRCP